MIKKIVRVARCLTLRVAQFFFHDNASPTGMRDRSKVKKTVPAQVPLGFMAQNPRQKNMIEKNINFTTK